MKQIILLGLSVISLSLWSDAAETIDDARRSERGRQNKASIPANQSERPEDREITESIRQAITKVKSVAVVAKNINIVSIDNKVTLRGPVGSADEKARIFEIAKATAGEIPVDNLIEVNPRHSISR